MPEPKKPKGKAKRKATSFTLGLNTSVKQIVRAGGCIRFVKKGQPPLPEEKKFPSGATRSGHLLERYDLMSPEANRRRATVYGKGAKNHGDRNWENGMPISECINRATRHLGLYLAGEPSEDHLAHAALNLDFIMHYELHNPECQDIPNQRGPNKFAMLEADYTRMMAHIQGKAPK